MSVRAGNYRLAFVLVTSLFFLWAVGHNLNDILIRQFQKALGLSRGQAGFVQSAFYIAYALTAIPAGLAMKRFGFKPAILIGLSLYAVGALMFLPAADLQRYELFLMALFVIASGIVFLEIAGSAYITLTAPKGKSVERINFAQSFNAVGGVVAPVIGGLFIFSGIEHSAEYLAQLSPSALDAYRAQEVQQVQGPYLGIAAAVTTVAVLIALTPFASSGRSRVAAAPPKKMFKALIGRRSFVTAVIAQFFYVGAQIGTWSYFVDFVKTVAPDRSEKAAAFFLSCSLFAFMVGRFAGTAMLRVITPTNLLIAYALINTVLVLLAVIASGPVAIIAMGATSFFMSIMFPTIYALGLENLGDEAELGSSIIIMSIISGAIIPPIVGHLSDSTSIRISYIFIALCYVMVGLATLCRNDCSIFLKNMKGVETEND